MEEQKPEACYACGFETSELNDYKTSNMPEEESMWLCGLCASTMSGTAYQYPNNFPDRSADVIHTICYVGNLILKELKSK